MSQETPLIRQYQAIKAEHSGAILLFRLGDFYEMFGDDARVASKVLQIALTTRDKGKENPVPMCGIPYFAAESYITKLIRAGHKVAVCEQIGDPRESKGIVEREVVRVITPGTHTPESPKENNYILAFAPLGGLHGIALADVSTGELSLYETSRPLEDELSRFEPREVLAPAALRDDFHYAEALRGWYVSYADEWPYDYEEAYKQTLRHFGVASLEGFGCEGMKAGVIAAWALIDYLLEAQKDALRFTKISAYSQGEHMALDTSTRNNLELTRNLRDGGVEGTLLWALDETLTPMGGRFLRSSILRPLLLIEEIRRRHAAVRYLVDDYELVDNLRRALRGIQDIERLAQRVGTRRASARDLAALRQSLDHMPEIKKALLRSNEHLLRIHIGEGLFELDELVDLLDRAIVDHPPATAREGGVIKAGFSPEVDELRGISSSAKDFIASLEAREREQTGINSLKVGYNRIFGYYIEITKANLRQAPERYERKQTLVGAERFVTEELKEYEAKVLGAEERIKTLELEVFESVLEAASGFAGEISANAASLAYLDFLVSLSVAAKRHNYIMPRMKEHPVISIKDGRHPVLERLSLGERFIPNDTLIDGEGHRVLIITGPNMAGKSTYMRQVALIVLMAQVGSFVPAGEAEIGLTDRIFTRIGASDFIARGQSTFMVEMIETANILNNATSRSLIILDEVGRGTSTFDGISIAWAAAEHIARKIRAMTLFATHYLELTELQRTIEGVSNHNIVVKEWGDEIVFLRKIAEGPADKSYGIHVGRLAGLPEEVIERARGVLKHLEEKRLEKGYEGGAAQLSLFAPTDERIMEELLRSDPDGLSPGEALALLRKWRGMASSLS